jgi:protein-glutamine gamma-glutamyltransferase
VKLLHSYRILRFALVLSAILAQCVALGNFPLLVIAGTLTALSWYVTEGPRGRSVPPWIARLLVLVALLYSLFDVFGPVDQLPMVLGQFVIWLTIVKLYGKRTVENEAQLLLLGLLLMTVGALYATDLLFGIMLVLWSGFAAWVLLLYQLHHGMETMREERFSAVPVEHSTPWTRPVTGLQVRKAFRQTATLFLFVGLLGSCLFFVATPRAKFDVVPKIIGASESELERMSLSPGVDEFTSNRQVMTVTLKDMKGDSVRMQQGLRLRGTVLDAYRGQGVWASGSHMKSTIETAEDKMTPLTMSGDGNANLTMLVVMHQPSSNVYSLYRPVGIETIPPSRVTQNLANTTLKLALGAEPIQQYELEIDFTSSVTSPLVNRRHRYYNEEVYALASRLLQEYSISVEAIAQSPELCERAARIFEQYLHSDEFTYSLDATFFSVDERIAMGKDEDPIASFILEHKRGHCEYFAAAMAAMCDTVNLPARVVTGYYVDRWDEVSNSYTVLQRDAHAWVEVEVEPMSWVTYDPTPSAQNNVNWQKEMSITQRIRFVWQKWELAWQSNVISFDLLAQKKLMAVVDPYWRSHLNSVKETFQDLYSGVESWFDIGAGGRIWIDLVMGAAVLSGFAILLVRWRRKRTSKMLSLSNEKEPAITVASVEFFARLQRVLSKHGKVKPNYIPAQTWIRGLSLNDGATEVAISLTNVYYRIRFGGYRPTRSQRLDLLHTVAMFEQLLKGDAS